VVGVVVCMFVSVNGHPRCLANEAAAVLAGGRMRRALCAACASEGDKTQADGNKSSIPLGRRQARVVWGEKDRSASGKERS
jgi:hypothetical protein